MFKKVLIATDGSPAAESVAACVGELRRLGTSEVLLARFFMIPEQIAFPDEIKSDIETSLIPVRDKLTRQGFSVKIVVEAGLPGLEIPRLAERENCSLIAAGSHGHGFAEEIFLGGTVAEILHRATRPLLIVRICSDPESDRVTCKARSCDFLRHVLFPTDFSPHAGYALDYLLEIAAAGAERISLLHVQDRSRLRGHLEHRLEEFNAVDAQRLDDLKKRLEAAGTGTVDTEICHGAPAAKILKRGEEASLILMGTHGRGYINELFLGSVSHNTARHASAPVLLIPAPFSKKKV
jgi:nucleotide-binding universal stress UspA family protein